MDASQAPSPEFLYAEWKRLHCGPRDMVKLWRKPRWKAALSIPWLWWSHYRVARAYATTYQAAELATIFVWAFWTTAVRAKTKERT